MASPPAVARCACSCWRTSVSRALSCDTSASASGVSVVVASLPEKLVLGDEAVDAEAGPAGVTDDATCAGGVARTGGGLAELGGMAPMLMMIMMMCTASCLSE